MSGSYYDTMGAPSSFDPSNMTYYPGNLTQSMGGVTGTQSTDQTGNATDNKTNQYTGAFAGLAGSVAGAANNLLGYMPLGEVQSYAGVYGLQGAVTEQTRTLLTHQAEALAPVMAENEDFSEMSPQEFAAMRRTAAINYTDVYVLNQLLHGLDQSYLDTLKQHN